MITSPVSYGNDRTLALDLLLRAFLIRQIEVLLRRANPLPRAPLPSFQPQPQPLLMASSSSTTRRSSTSTLPRGYTSEIDVILAGGQIVKTYPGTSQYQQGTSISACGLASFNAVKCIMNLEKNGCTGRDLVENMLSRELVEVRTQGFGVEVVWR